MCLYIYQEMLDTAVARQQLLLRQQQEVLAYNHRQQVEQQAQTLVNNSLAVGTTSTTPITRQLAPQPLNNDHQRLSALLNEACVLTPQQSPGLYNPAGYAGYSHAPVTVLSNQMPVAGLGLHPPGAPGGLSMMGQDELMQAVRKELKRMQQE